MLCSCNLPLQYQNLVGVEAKWGERTHTSDAWLVQSAVTLTLDLRVVSSCSTLGTEPMKEKIQRKGKGRGREGKSGRGGRKEGRKEKEERKGGREGSTPPTVASTIIL